MTATTKSVNALWHIPPTNRAPNAMIKLRLNQGGVLCQKKRECMN